MKFRIYSEAEGQFLAKAILSQEGIFYFDEAQTKPIPIGMSYRVSFSSSYLDKEGKEIYYGDILEIDPDEAGIDEPYDSSLELLYVSYDCDGFFIADALNSSIKDPLSNLLDEGENNKHVKVSGNIFQNSEVFL